MTQYPTTKAGAVQAVTDYFAGLISKDKAVEVVLAYFSSSGENVAPSLTTTPAPAVSQAAIDAYRANFNQQTGLGLLRGAFPADVPKIMTEYGLTQADVAAAELPATVKAAASAAVPQHPRQNANANPLLAVSAIVFLIMIFAIFARRT